MLLLFSIIIGQCFISLVLPKFWTAIIHKVHEHEVINIHSCSLTTCVSVCEKTKSSHWTFHFQMEKKCSRSNIIHFCFFFFCNKYQHNVPNKHWPPENDVCLLSLLSPHVWICSSGDTKPECNLKWSDFTDHNAVAQNYSTFCEEVHRPQWIDRAVGRW